MRRLEGKVALVTGGNSSAQSVSVRSAAVIAMPDSIGSNTPTAPNRRISERPNEPILSELAQVAVKEGSRAASS
jgi:hypothetical protein